MESQTILLGLGICSNTNPVKSYRPAAVKLEDDSIEFVPFFMLSGDLQSLKNDAFAQLEKFFNMLEKESLENGNTGS